jgi:hypothetical protein
VETTLPKELQEAFSRFITTEYTTIDRRGQPITWPVTPYYVPGDDHIDITTGLGYPKKANDAATNPKVALLFSDPTGCGLSDPPTVLVQGTASVDDRALEANRERYTREAVEKLPATKNMLPPKFLRALFNWYFTRIYVHVRPERIYVWRGEEPELLDAQIEEVRSGHVEQPVEAPPSPAGGEPVWDERMEQLGELYRTAVLSIVAPDGFPFSGRVPVSVDSSARRVRIGSLPIGLPMQPGLACIAAHDHSPDFTWQRNFQVRGDLVEDDEGWALVPHKLVGGFELPPTSKLGQYRANLGKSLRFRRTAKRELERRSG